MTITSRPSPATDSSDGKDGNPRGPRRVRRVLGIVFTVLAAVLVYAAMVVPDNVFHHKDTVSTAAGFFRIPLEAIVGGAVFLALSGIWRRLAAIGLGLGLGALAALKITNAGFLIVLGRRFNPVLDWSLFHDGYNALSESDGTTTATAAAIGSVLLAVLVVGLLVLSVIRLANVTARFANPARRTLVALSAVWIALALTGVTFFPGNPIASDSAAALAKSTAKQIPAALADQKAFNEAAANDPYNKIPASERVAALKGKDVVINVVESYGRSGLTDPAMSAIIGPTLAAGTQTLAAKGYYAKSGWLTSSTFGGGSWLAHASLQSGLWIDGPQRYKQLTASDRLTLTKAFHEAGWNTYGFEPGNTVAWPEAKFYQYDTVYDSRNLGYQGPRFGWSNMPDQYTLAQFQKDVYSKPHKPLLAEITMTSSHEPWTPVPHFIDWDQIGNGQIYAPMALQGENRNVLWKDAKKTQAEYAKSISYSMQTLVSWVEKYADQNLVLVIFGDHQPFSIVSGDNASHDIPITIVAHDKTVLDKISSWDWSDGLRPAADAPVWKMSDFRNRFFDAYGTDPQTAK